MSTTTHFGPAFGPGTVPLITGRLLPPQPSAVGGSQCTIVTIVSATFRQENTRPPGTCPPLAQSHLGLSTCHGPTLHYCWVGSDGSHEWFAVYLQRMEIV